MTTENQFLGDCLNRWNPAHSTGSFLAATRRDPKPLRIALNLSEPPVAIDPACRSAVIDAARLLEQLGHAVEEARPGLDFERVNIVQNTLMATVLAAGLPVGAMLSGRVGENALL